MRLVIVTLSALIALFAVLYALYIIDYMVGVIRYLTFTFNRTAHEINSTAASRVASKWQPLAPDVEAMISAAIPFALAALGLALFATYAHTRRR